MKRLVRWKVVFFTPQIITDWIIEGRTMPKNALLCVKGIPEDARFIHGFYSIEKRAFAGVFECAEWEEVELVEGMAETKLPQIDVLVEPILTYRKIGKKRTFDYIESSE